MAKFNKGDKVRVFKGIHEGTTGVVADPWWQVSQSDWPRVEFTTEDGMYFYADEDEMELTEDPYEYAVKFTLMDGDELPVESWGTKESAESRMEYREKMFRERKYGMRLVKRRKAGPVEDA